MSVQMLIKANALSETDSYLRVLADGNVFLIRGANIKLFDAVALAEVLKVDVLVSKKSKYTFKDSHSTVTSTSFYF